MPHPRYPKEILLKDHKEILLNIPEPEDIERLICFYQRLRFSFQHLFKEDPCEPHVIREWLHHQQLGKAFSIIATHEGKIVAHAMLLNPCGSEKSTAHLQIMVDPEFREKQLGTWMIFDLTKRAMEMELEQIRADFIVGFDDNAAIHAFHSMDFVKEGVIRDHIQDKDGKYYDCHMMSKPLILRRRYA